jgi:hypothetical protein
MIPMAYDNSTIEALPNELLLRVTDDLLNPAERARISVCNQRLKALLPTSLRVKISCAQGSGALQPEFFVSPAEQPGKLLESSENLVFGCEYLFWSFDYERGNKTYLGRHTKHAHQPDENGELGFLYTIGMRPCHPNQTWQVVGGNHGDTVMWGEDVSLSVGGKNPKARQPDSMNLGSLCCLPDSFGPLWYVINGNCGETDKLTLLPSSQYIPCNGFPEKNLIVHAIPDVCDDGEYLLHSPKSAINGTIYCEGYHVIVDFNFWISKGVMHFCAPVLPFTLGIPILETDVLHPDPSPLAKLLKIKSARWGCVIYYMAVAADVREGKPLDMERFIDRVTDHRDHQVKLNEARDLVYIDVLKKRVNTKAMSLPKEENAVWRFILSW